MYNISKSIEKNIKQNRWEDYSYYDLFMNKNSILNKTYLRNNEFDKSNILKITFYQEDGVDVEKLLKKIERINFVRIGSYERHFNNGKTILVSIGKNCKEPSKKIWCAFKVIKEIISFMQKSSQIADNDLRYVGVVKYFLYYLLGEYPIKIIPTIDDKTCIIVKRGYKAKKEELENLISKYDKKNEDVKHEADVILNYLNNDQKGDTAVIICSSIILFEKLNHCKKKHEYDGMIIYPFRPKEQVIFFEAKNTNEKPNRSIKCLKDKLKSTSIDYSSAKFILEGMDCVWEYSLEIP